MPEPWFDELSQLIAIPSVSADSAHDGNVRRAAEWVAGLVRDAGGTAEIVETASKPLVVGNVRASADADKAPTVLCYCHFDVQPPAPLEPWESDPFKLTERNGWLFGRGIADDKGQLYIVLSAVRSLAAENKLPVNIRVAFDGEEESGGTAISDWVAADDGPADACLILDGGMTERDKPEFTIATRGLIAFDITVHGTQRSAFGHVRKRGLNAIHALMECLSAILPRDGRLPGPLRAGVAEPTAGRARRLGTAQARLRDLGGRRARAVRRACERGVLPAHLGGAVRRDQRHPRRQADPQHDADLQRACELHLRLAPGRILTRSRARSGC